MQMHSSLSVFLVCVVLVVGQANCARKVINAPPELAGPIVENISKCIQETNNNPEKILTAIKENKVVENDAFMKFLDCTFQKSGYANPDGTLDAEKCANVFPKDFDMITVFENCNKHKGGTRAETTFKIYKCYQQTSPLILAFQF